MSLRAAIHKPTYLIYSVYSLILYFFLYVHTYVYQGIYTIFSRLQTINPQLSLLLDHIYKQCCQYRVAVTGLDTIMTMCLIDICGYFILYTDSVKITLTLTLI